MKNNTIVDWFALLLKVTLAGVVLVFLGSESIAFFTFIFPADQWFMAYTGFGLTSGAFLVYLFLFLKNAKTDLQKTVAIIMMFVGIGGELATAGFGMQVEAWDKQGWVMAQSDFDFMVLAVRGLMFAHALALLAYSFGDEIMTAFDKNNNGIPDMLEKKPMRQFGATVGNANNKDAEIANLKKRLAELEKSPKTDSQQPTE